MTARVLIVDGHPDARAERYGHEIVRAYCRGAQAGGAAVRVITIADHDIPPLKTADDFTTAPTDPFILKAREDMEWANHLVLVFPLWLGSAPAVVKAFFEQVARGEFVASVSKTGWRQRFRGRSARMIVTMGMPAFIFRTIFGGHGVSAWRKSILGFAGFGPVRTTLLGAVGAVGREEMERRLRRIEALGRALS